MEDDLEQGKEEKPPPVRKIFVPKTPNVPPTGSFQDLRENKEDRSEKSKDGNAGRDLGDEEKRKNEGSKEGLGESLSRDVGKRTFGKFLWIFRSKTDNKASKRRLSSADDSFSFSAVSERASVDSNRFNGNVKKANYDNFNGRGDNNSGRATFTRLDSYGSSNTKNPRVSRMAGLPSRGKSLNSNATAHAAANPLGAKYRQQYRFPSESIDQSQTQSSPNPSPTPQAHREFQAQDSFSKDVSRLDLNEPGTPDSRSTFFPRDNNAYDNRTEKIDRFELRAPTKSSDTTVTEMKINGGVALSEWKKSETTKDGIADRVSSKTFLSEEIDGDSNPAMTFLSISERYNGQSARGYRNIQKQGSKNTKTTKDNYIHNGKQKNRSGKKDSVSNNDKVNSTISSRNSWNSNPGQNLNGLTDDNNTGTNLHEYVSSSQKDQSGGSEGNFGKTSLSTGNKFDDAETKAKDIITTKRSFNFRLSFISTFSRYSGARNQEQQDEKAYSTIHNRFSFLDRLSRRKRSKSQRSKSVGTRTGSFQSFNSGETRKRTISEIHKDTTGNEDGGDVDDPIIAPKKPHIFRANFGSSLKKLVTVNKRFDKRKNSYGRQNSAQNRDLDDLATKGPTAGPLNTMLSPREGRRDSSRKELQKAEISPIAIICLIFMCLVLLGVVAFVAVFLIQDRF